MHLKLCLIPLILALAACGNDDETPDKTSADMNVADMAADQSPTPDQPTDTPDTPVDTPDTPIDTPDLPGDMTETPDAEPDLEPCDEAATAAALVAVHEDISAGAVTTTGQGELTATIDASAGGAAMAAGRSFLYLDLATGQPVALSDKDAFTANTWHLGLKRSELRINSADSGPGALLLARVDGADWDTAQPPNPAGGGWLSDDFVSDTCEVTTYGQGTIQTAFGQWYDYDAVAHTLSVPEDTVFFLYDAATHAAFKLQITGYDSGIYTLRWAPLGQ
jgi:hypothetical protein